MSEINNQKDSSKGIKVAMNSTLPPDSCDGGFLALSNSVQKDRLEAIRILTEKVSKLKEISTRLDIDLWKAGFTDLLKKYLPPGSAIIAKLEESPFKSKGKALTQLEYSKKAFRALNNEAIWNIKHLGVYISPVETLRKNWFSRFSNVQLASGILAAVTVLVQITSWGSNVLDAQGSRKQAEEICALKQQLTEYINRDNRLREDSACRVLIIGSLQDSIMRLNNRIKGQ